MKAATAPPAGLEQLERAIFDVARGIVGRTAGIMTPNGHRLDKAGYFLLDRLDAAGSVRLSDLAATVGLDVSTISRQIRALEDIGFVTRSPDPDDGRAARVEVSPAGHDSLTYLRDARHTMLATALDGWSEDERSTLIDQLNRLAEGLGSCAHLTQKSHPRSTSREVLPA